jgi:hypothetical protein
VWVAGRGRQGCCQVLPEIHRPVGRPSRRGGRKSNVGNGRSPEGRVVSARRGNWLQALELALGHTNSPCACTRLAGHPVNSQRPRHGQEAGGGY